MVDTFLEGARPTDPDDAEFAAEHGRPNAAEVASVVALAVRLRLGGAGAPPHYLAWGAAVRLVALVGLLAHTALALVDVGALVFLTLRFPALTAPVPGVPSAAGGSQAVWAVAGLLWVPAT